MHPPDEFLKHALDCQQMAKTARDRQSKETWQRMAERWRVCAERFSNTPVVVRREAPRRRRPPLEEEARV
jgi:hypothetical protein